jgi:hypothetical protein
VAIDLWPETTKLANVADIRSARVRRKYSTCRYSPDRRFFSFFGTPQCQMIWRDAVDPIKPDTRRVGTGCTPGVSEVFLLRLCKTTGIKGAQSGAEGKRSTSTSPRAGSSCVKPQRSPTEPSRRLIRTLRLWNCQAQSCWSVQAARASRLLESSATGWNSWLMLRSVCTAAGAVRAIRSGAKLLLANPGPSVRAHGRIRRSADGDAARVL